MLSAFDGENADGTWTLNVSDNAGIDVGRLRRFSLIFSCPPPPCRIVVSYTGPAVPIPDNLPAGVNIPLVVAGVGTFFDLNFRFDPAVSPAVCDATFDPTVDPGTPTHRIGNPNAAVDHSFVGDLTFRLTSPGGTTVTFMQRRGGTRENICLTEIDDEGGFPNVSTITSVTGSTIAGHFEPETTGMLSAFDGENADGTWTLNVSDNAGIDVGRLRRFSLEFNEDGCPVCLTPTVNPVANQTVCNGAATAAINFTGTPPTATFDWTNNTPSIGLAASGTGNIASFNAVNTGTAPVVATITVTPKLAGCPDGVPVTFTVTVNPTATVNAVANQTVCNAANTAAVTFSSPTTGGTIVYNWTNNTPSIGLAASGTGNIASFVATNTGTAPVTATITVTPTYTNGVSCVGTPITFTITVNPTATANVVANQTLCNGASTAAVTFSSPTTGGTIVYNWTNNTPSIGLAASGTGNIASFVATNATPAPVTATITVTPSYTNGVTCVGTPRTFTITVNPTPIAVATPATQTICSNTAIAPIVLTSTTAGTTFAWTRNNTATVTGIAASGSGNITGTLVNTTTAAVTVTFTITPTANGCPGAPITATVTVQASLIITCPANISTTTPVGSCTATVNYTPTITGTPAPTVTYSFSGATTGAGSGTGSGSVFNIGATTVTVTATNICATVSCMFTITVLDGQLPVINTQPANRTVCAGQNATFSVVAVTSPNAGGPLSYQWQQWNGSAWVNVSGATASSFTVNAATVAMNTNTFRCVVTGLCTIVNSGAATLFVNPLPTISIAAITLNALQPTQSTNVVATVNPPGGSFVWTRNGTNIGVSGPTVGPLTVDNLGTYLAVYTDPNGCQVTSSSLVISALASDNIWIYPNPNSGQFSVRYYNQSGESVTINVFNALGQLVYQKATGTGTPYSLTTVTLPATAANGVYIVKVLGASGKELAAKKIIVLEN